MGRSSCNVDVDRADWVGHKSWNTQVADHAAQPHAPEASVQVVVGFMEDKELLDGHNRPQSEEGLPPAEVRPGWQI